MDSDTSLIKIVFHERRGSFTISASITRYGTLCVLACTDDMAASWQGTSILDARAWVDSDPFRDSADIVLTRRRP